MAQSLEQLKQENAKEEASIIEGELVNKDEIETNELSDGSVDELAASEKDQDEESESLEGLDDETKDEAPVELWMQEEEQTSLNNDNESFDSSDMARLRRKLKAKNEEKDDEIKQLKREMEELRTGQTNQSTAQTSVKAIARPKLEDFDYDEDEYNIAIDNYYFNRMSQNNEQSQSKAQQEQEQQKAQQLHQSKLDSHYEQVQDLISSNTLTAEMYQNSEVVLRKALDNVSKGNGDNLTDTIIAQLTNMGTGGAKVITHLGRNETNRNRLVTALTNDPSGLSMMGILGELKATLTSAPSKKISSAPKPSAKLSGGENGGDNAAKLARKYKEAHKKGDSQAAFNAKREAKAAGISTRNWS